MENSGLQPGQTITPSSGAPPAAPGPAKPQPPPPAAPPATPAPAPPPAAEPEPQPAIPTGLKQPPDQPADTASSFFNPSDTEDPYSPDNQQSPSDGPDEISWTASEFVAHEKSSGWYLALMMAAVAVAGLIYLITRDFVSVGVVVFGALMLGVYGARQPRQLEYRIDGGGIGIGQKYYEFGEFRTFTIIPEGAFSSIVFMPLKRFGAPTTIYYDPKDEANIVNILSDRLPFEEGGHDMVDRLMRRIRF